MADFGDQIQKKIIMNKRPLVTAGLILGIGLGGFIDGILFHQIFQFHSMLSAVLPQTTLLNVKVSMFWDGLFHLFTWIATISGIVLLWHSSLHKMNFWNGTALFGAILSGCGLFNFVEGAIDHYLLQIHHVYENAGLSVYDHLFLASGIIFMYAGSRVIKRSIIKAPFSGTE